MFLLLLSGKVRPCNFFFKITICVRWNLTLPKMIHGDREHKGQTLIRIKKLTQNFRINKFLNSEADTMGDYLLVIFNEEIRDVNQFNFE